MNAQAQQHARVNKLQFLAERGLGGAEEDSVAAECRHCSERDLSLTQGFHGACVCAQGATERVGIFENEIKIGKS